MYIRYTPDYTKSLAPVQINYRGAHALFLIPGEVQWINEDELKLLEAHPSAKYLFDNGEFKVIQPNKEGDPKELDNYTEDDFEEIINGTYDIQVLDNFLDTMRFSDRYYRFLIRDQIEKLRDNKIPHKLTYEAKVSLFMRITDKFYVSIQELNNQAWRNQFNRQLPVG